MINLKSSNNLALGDCLGGYVSLQDFPAWTPIIDSDQIRCLFIDSFRLKGGYDLYRAEFTIVKSDDDFTLTISYPTETEGWATLEAIEFTLSVDDVYQSTDDLADIRIRRVLTGADGTMVGRIATPYNTALGGDNLDIAGGSVTRYGVIFIEVEDDTYIDTISAYGIVEGAVDTDACQIDIMTDGLYTQRIATNATAPTGLTWTNTETISGTVSAGTYALWFKTISSGAIGEITYVIEIDQSGDGEKVAILGKHRRYDATLDGYVLYGAYDGSVVGGTEIDTFAAIPGTVALSLPPSGTRDYRLRVVARNKYGVESQNQLLRHGVIVNAAGADVSVPQTPSSLSLTFLSGGNAKLQWTYAFDTLNPVVYAQVEIGTETDRGITISGFGTYTARTIDPVLWGESITARVRFVDRKARAGAWATTTGDAAFTPATIPLKTMGRTGGIQGAPTLDSRYRVDRSGDATLVSEPGRVSFFYDGTLEFYAQFNASNELILYFNGWKRINGVVSGAQTDVIEDAGGGVVYISDGTTRRVKLDTTAKTFTAGKFNSFLPLCRRDESVSTVSGIRYMTAYPTTINATQAPQPWIGFDDDYVYLPKYEQP